MAHPVEIATGRVDHRAHGEILQNKWRAFPQEFGPAERGAGPDADSLPAARLLQ
jgi:hypothetical protein